jgi:DNA-binding winged helix-turn-helix (wHTH) protein
MTESSSRVPGRPVGFDAYQLDVARHRLCRGEHEIPLRPKSWDVLCYLVERPGLLVTKDALHREMWPDTAVSDNTLTQVITELRQALGDKPRTPRIIETVHGRGFRFVAEVKSLGEETGAPTSAAEDWAPMATLLRGETAPAFVGRQAELARLHECFSLASQGARQIVFISSSVPRPCATQAFASCMDSASANTGRASHTCPCWKPSSGCSAHHMARR